MGQYYKTIIEQDGKTQILSADAWKLMEFSYLGDTEAANITENLFCRPGRIAVVGDYTDDAPVRNHDSLSESTQLDLYDLIWKENESDEAERVDVPHKPLPLHRYVLNHTKKLIIDLVEYASLCGRLEGIAEKNSKAFLESIGTSSSSWRNTPPHPLMLLTAIGNGAGGGDYPEGMPFYNLTGTWAWDLIEIRDDLPDGILEKRDGSEPYRFFICAFSDTVSKGTIREKTLLDAEAYSRCQVSAKYLVDLSKGKPSGYTGPEKSIAEDMVLHALQVRFTDNADNDASIKENQITVMEVGPHRYIVEYSGIISSASKWPHRKLSEYMDIEDFFDSPHYVQLEKLEKENMI